MVGKVVFSIFLLLHLPAEHTMSTWQKPHQAQGICLAEDLLWKLSKYGDLNQNMQTISKHLILIFTELVKSMNRTLDEKSNKNYIKSFFFSKWILMYCLMVFLKISSDGRDRSESGPLCCASNSLQLVAAWQTFSIFSSKGQQTRKEEGPNFFLFPTEEIKRN